MTASLYNQSGGNFANIIDAYVYPQFITAQRTPNSQDIYPPGTRWLNQAVSPALIYETVGGGEWDTGGVQPATTTTYGTVILTDNSEPVATKVYADNLAIAGAPVATTTVAGIGELATDAEAVAGTASTPSLALLVTPSNFSAVFASPPATGGTSPAAGVFTTLESTGLFTGDASATIATAGTAMNLATDDSGDDVNIGAGAVGRNINVGANGGDHAVVVGNTGGSSSLTLQAGDSNLIIFTSGVGDIRIDSDDTLLLDCDGVLELNSSAGVISIGNDANNQNINIGSAGTRTIQVGSDTATLNLFSSGGINMGTNTVQQPIVIGNNTGNTAVTIESGTGDIKIGRNIAKTIEIGNTTGASSLSLRVGTGNFALDGNAASTYAVGASTTTGTLTLGGTAQTGDIVLGSSSGTNAVKIMNGSGAGTLSLGVVQTAGAINAGTAMTSGTITIGGTGAHTGTIAIAPGTGAQTVNIANSTGVKTINIGTGAAANVVTIGTTNTTAALTLNSGSGNINATGGNLKIATTGKGLQIKAGAATDMAGTAVLVAGTVTVANTNIATGDLIFLSRVAANASTTLGQLSYTISNATSFTITSLILGTPGSTQTGDVSTVSYFIVRPV